MVRTFHYTRAIGFLVSTSGIELIGESGDSSATASSAWGPTFIFLSQQEPGLEGHRLMADFPALRFEMKA